MRGRIVRSLIVLADGLPVGVRGRVELALLQVDIAQAGVRQGIMGLSASACLISATAASNCPLLHTHQPQVEMRAGVLLPRQGRGIGGGRVPPLLQALVRCARAR
ncbi:hypothetical protein [Candidatus Amarolinea dominans]|uniref:hypothetical protein n=1 Tax=Candidatus Amarolinea dominans TaxID=3140696 RepID=UPI0031CCD5EE